jgi:hypothetical protein
VSKYIPEAPIARENETTDVLIRETGQGTRTQHVRAAQGTSRSVAYPLQSAMARPCSAPRRL